MRLECSPAGLAALLGCPTAEVQVRQLVVVEFTSSLITGLVGRKLYQLHPAKAGAMFIGQA